MANQVDPRLAAARPTVDVGAGTDEGLRSYMLSVYNYMASGVLLTGLVAMIIARTPALLNMFFTQDLATGRIGATGLGWVVMIAPLALVLLLSFGINKLSESSAKAIFWVYAGMMGASLSIIFLQYTGASIASTFFATAAGFGALSIYGYTTKRDLSGFGKFLLMGLVGLIIASVINMFTRSGTANLVISILGVFLFAGLTVYDTQKIKMVYYQVQGSDMMGKAVIMGALTLYLDFINLFLFLLRFMGDRR